MINDPTVRSDIAQQWAAVKLLSWGSRRAFPIPGAGGDINVMPPEEFYNLPFVLDYAVLDQVLDELTGQGTFPRPVDYKHNKPIRRPMLAAKM